MEFILQGDFANALDVFESTVQSVEALLDANAVAGEQALHDLQCSHLHSLLDKALCEYKLSLHRRCVKSCKHGVISAQNYLLMHGATGAHAFAYTQALVQCRLWHARVHVAMGKADSARNEASAAVAAITAYCNGSIIPSEVVGVGLGRGRGRGLGLGLGAGIAALGAECLQFLRGCATGETVPPSTPAASATVTAESIFPAVPVAPAVAVAAPPLTSHTPPPAPAAPMAAASSACVIVSARTGTGVSSMTGKGEASPPASSSRSKLLAIRETLVSEAAAAAGGGGSGGSGGVGRALGVEASVLEIARQQMSLPTGEGLVDDLVAIGYLHVNTGNIQGATNLFQCILEYRWNAPAAHLGVGTAQAMCGQYAQAIESFTHAIEQTRASAVTYGTGAALTAYVDADVAEAWKRRGQCNNAIGSSAAAWADLHTASHLAPEDADTYYQLGIVAHGMKEYGRALPFFEKAVRLGCTHAQCMNFLAMVLGQLGSARRSIHLHFKACTLNASLVEAKLNAGQMYKELGEWRSALVVYRFVLAQLGVVEADPALPMQHIFSGEERRDKHVVTALVYRATVLHAMGRAKEAARDLFAAAEAQHAFISSAAGSTAGCAKKGSDSSAAVDVAVPASVGAAGWLEFTPTTKFQLFGGHVRYADAVGLLSACLLAQGKYVGAMMWLDLACKASPGHWCMYAKQVAIQCCVHVDVDVRAWTLDAAVAPEVKENWCKKEPAEDGGGAAGASFSSGHSAGGAAAAESTPHAALIAERYVETRYSAGKNGAAPCQAAVMALLREAQRYIPYIQLKCEGFIPNVRQHTQFGLSVREMVQQLHAICASTASSSIGGGGGSGWRDWFQTCVRWRQVSEPNDPVWWIDGMPRQSYHEGFGLQTPIVNGQWKTIRYYPYFQRALSVMKSLVVERRGYYDVSSQWISMLKDSDSLAKVENSDSLEELFLAIGCSFYVVVPVLSAVRAADSLEGTRLTLLASKSPSGFEFSIRTPGTPARWASYDREMTHYFANLRKVCAKEMAVSRALAKPAAKAETDSSERIRTRAVLHAALALFYCWVTFAPLSRGTAACGYAALIAAISASGYAVRQWLPAGVQLDWEAILSVSLEEFIARAEGLISICIQNEDDVAGAASAGASGATTAAAPLSAAAVATRALESRCSTEQNSVADGLLRSCGGRLHVLNTAAEVSPQPLAGITSLDMELLVQAAERWGEHV